MSNRGRPNMRLARRLRILRANCRICHGGLTNAKHFRKISASTTVKWRLGGTGLLGELFLGFADGRISFFPFWAVLPPTADCESPRVFLVVVDVKTFEFRALESR